MFCMRASQQKEPIVKEDSLTVQFEGMVNDRENVVAHIDKRISTRSDIIHRLVDKTARMKYGLHGGETQTDEGGRQYIIYTVYPISYSHRIVKIPTVTFLHLRPGKMIFE